MKFRIVLIILSLLATVAVASPPAYAQESCPDLTDLGPSVEMLSGAYAYTNINLPTVVDEPLLVLNDEAYTVLGRRGEYPPGTGQIPGRLTSDFFQSPASYAVALPIQPSALSTDLDQDSTAETGVQVFSVMMAQNIFNAPTIEGVAQQGIAKSIILDKASNTISTGALLLYTPDNDQGFPCAAGADGELFTADDRIATLPAGYTVARIADGTVTFERGAAVTVDILEESDVATPDFSNQGILESFDTLIGFLKERYVFTVVNGIDWDALAAKYRPRVEEADQTNNLGLYFLALFDLAQEQRDAHVGVTRGQVLAQPEGRAAVLQFLGPLFGGIGATPIELDDGRVIIGALELDGPAAQAGLTFGTEILAVNGTPVAEAILQRRYDSFPGTAETQRIAQVERLLRTTVGSGLELTYQLPAASEATTTVITATAATGHKSSANPMPMRYDLIDGFGYVTWPAFQRTGIANHIFEDFIKVVNDEKAPGIILDLRGNGGGSVLLMYAVLSYLYGPDAPLTFDDILDLTYDVGSGEFITVPDTIGPISSLTEVAPYTGTVVVLVDNHCVSACEFTSFHLQHSGRGVIIGQYATNGAGGNVQSVILPGQMEFKYTAGTNVFADTQQPTFQGKGVVPDLRVPVTEETERQKLEGGDPVLDAALTYLKEQTATTPTGTTTPGATAAVTTTETMTTTHTVTTTAATTATTMPNLADYPHLAAQQSFFIEQVGPVIIAECPALFSGAGFPRPEPDYTGKQVRDLSAFEDALADLTPERVAELNDLVLGKTIPQLQTLFDEGDLTAEELVLYYVDRIRRYDIDKLNSVITLNPAALELARTLDAELAAGTVRGAMHGIPVLLKDNIATGDGMPTTAGAAVLQDWQPDRDAFLVQQIRAAGGIILGKANLSEWANYNDPCMPSGFSVVGGQTRNPYGAFDTMGSSSGSAASVAANLTTVSVGSETSGSLIQPARVQSVAALRPSQGLISRDYVVPLGAHLDTPGPMGRSVTDVAILLNAMAGVDANDPKTADAAPLAGVDFTTYLDLERAKGLRVGVVMFEQTIAAQKANAEQATGKTIPDEVVSSLISIWIDGDPFQAKAALEAQGITVVEIKEADLPPFVDTAQPQLIYGFGADLNAFLAGLDKPAPISSIADVVAFNEQDMANRAPYNHRYVKWSAESEITPTEHAQIVAEAQAYANGWMNGLLETYDVDLLVVATRYASNAGAAGIPALTIPAGLDANGKPTGIIITGPYLSEPNLFAVGYALEQALQGRVEPDLAATIEQIEAITTQ